MQMQRMGIYGILVVVVLVWMQEVIFKVLKLYITSNKTSPDRNYHERHEDLDDVMAIWCLHFSWKWHNRTEPSVLHLRIIFNTQSSNLFEFDSNRAKRVMINSLVYKKNQNLTKKFYYFASDLKTSKTHKFSFLS